MGARTGVSGAKLVITNRSPFVRRVNLSVRTCCWDAHGVSERGIIIKSQTVGVSWCFFSCLISSGNVSVNATPRLTYMLAAVTTDATFFEHREIFLNNFPLLGAILGHLAHVIVLPCSICGISLEGKTSCSTEDRLDEPRY